VRTGVGVHQRSPRGLAQPLVDGHPVPQRISRPQRAQASRCSTSTPGAAHSPAGRCSGDRGRPRGELLLGGVAAFESQHSPERAREAHPLSPIRLGVAPIARGSQRYRWEWRTRLRRSRAQSARPPADSLVGYAERSPESALSTRRPAPTPRGTTSPAPPPSSASAAWPTIGKLRALTSNDVLAVEPRSSLARHDKVFPRYPVSQLDRRARLRHRPVAVCPLIAVTSSAFRRACGRVSQGS